MRRYYIPLFSVLLALTSSCSKETKEESLPESDQLITITAYTEGGTKTSLVDNGTKKSVVWEPGDAISLFANSGTEGGNKFTTESDGPKATFTGSITSVLGDLSGVGESFYFWGLYPYDPEAECDGTSITTSLPVIQASPEGEVADNLLITAARSENLAMYFRNTLAVVGITVSQEDIHSITFYGHNRENISGEFSIFFDENGEVVTCVGDDVSSKLVRVIPSEAETFSVGSTYYFAFIPTDFSLGYSLVFEKTDGSEATYVRESGFVFRKGVFYTMTNKDQDLTFEIPEKPLTFTATGSNAISLIKHEDTEEVDLPLFLEYKKGDSFWKPYAIGDEVLLADGESVSFRSFDRPNEVISYAQRWYQFVNSGEGTVAASGNIMSLLDKSMQTTYVPDYCFESMFLSMTSLTAAPELPATHVGFGAYDSMFQGCTFLTEGPSELPATIIGGSCYANMFADCKSLSSTVDCLPAKELADYCYSAMYWGCSSLTAAPELGAEVLAENCCDHMFYLCESLAETPSLPVETLAPWCYYHMFFSCTSLVQSPDLPATQLAYNCYAGMFMDCKSLKYGPDELPAETVASNCYEEMFKGCIKLEKVPRILPSLQLMNSCYYQMFEGCTSLNTAPKLPATVLAENCYLSMFKDCSSLATAPDLLATELKPACYQYMFLGCSSLTYVKMMAVELSSNSLSSWITNVGTNGTFVKNKNATWNVSGVDGIPDGWNVIEI